MVGFPFPSFVGRGLLEYTAHEAILCHNVKTQWLPQDNHTSRIVIGKSIQGAKNGEQYLQRRIVIDQVGAKLSSKARPRARNNGAHRKDTADE